MTRINLVPVEELYDQHLFAEYREIKMVPKSLARSLKAAEKHPDVARRFLTPIGVVLEKVPKMFTLNTGHVSFFYDKGAYLRERYAELCAELDHRNVNYDKTSKFDPDGVMLHHSFDRGYVPTPEALAIVRARIAEKIAMKPDWYRYTG